MPRGSKKRKAAKKKRENQPNNPSSASAHSHDVKQHDELKINSTDENGLKIDLNGAKSNGTNGGVDHDDKAAKSCNGRSSSNSGSGSSSDEEDPIRATESLILEENEKKSSPEAIVQSVEEKTDTVLDQTVFATQETESVFVDNRVEQEKESAVTAPLLDRPPCPEEKTSWKNCCGLFEVFSGSGR